jgi:hypothetical protein
MRAEGKEEWKAAAETSQPTGFEVSYCYTPPFGIRDLGNVAREGREPFPTDGLVHIANGFFFAN